MTFVRPFAHHTTSVLQLVRSFVRSIYTYDCLTTSRYDRSVFGYVSRTPYHSYMFRRLSYAFRNLGIESSVRLLLVSYVHRFGSSRSRVGPLAVSLSPHQSLHFVSVPRPYWPVFPFLVFICSHQSPWHCLSVSFPCSIKSLYLDTRIQNSFPLRTESREHF